VEKIERTPLEKRGGNSEKQLPSHAGFKIKAERESPKKEAARPDITHTAHRESVLCETIVKSQKNQIVKGLKGISSRVAQHSKKDIQKKELHMRNILTKTKWPSLSHKRGMRIGGTEKERRPGKHRWKWEGNYTEERCKKKKWFR